MPPLKTSKAISRLQQQQPVFGALQAIPSAALTEITLWCGFDFIILDCEHGVLDEPSLLASLQVISGTDAFSIVRVKAGDFGAVGRYLDFGANGILLPDVRNVSEARAFVAAATHGAQGTRSSSGNGSRAQRYGLAGHQPEAALLLAMIEGSEAVSNIDAIASVPGLAGLVIGPHDLAADLGTPGDFSTATYQAAFSQVEQAALRAGILLGSRTHAGFCVERLLAAGHRFILTSGDIAALRDGYRAHLDAVRGAQSL